MYLNLRTTLGIIILAAAAFGSWWLAQAPSDPDSLPLGRGVPPPGYYLREAKVRHSGPDGKLLFEINAQSAQQNAAWRIIVSKGLSVRETERLINRLKSETKKPRKPTADSEQRYFTDLGEALSRRFGTQVQIKRHGRKGTLEIKFFSDDDLDRVLSLLKKV